PATPPGRSAARRSTWARRGPPRSSSSHASSARRPARRPRSSSCPTRPTTPAAPTSSPACPTSRASSRSSARRAGRRSTRSSSRSRALAARLPRALVRLVLDDADLVEDRLVGEQPRAHARRDGHRVAGPRVELEAAPALAAEVHARVEHVVLELGDLDRDELDAGLLHERGEDVVRHRPPRLDAVHLAVDLGHLVHRDDDREDPSLLLVAQVHLALGALVAVHDAEELDLLHHGAEYSGPEWYAARTG